MITLLLLLVAAVLAAFAAFGAPSGRFNPLAAAVFFFVLAFLVPLFVALPD